MIFCATVLSIGPYSLNSNVLLAPMAGVSDLPFRQICKQYGAGLATSEMLHADSRLWHTRKSSQRLRQDPNKKTPNSVQIVGFDAKMLADAAEQAILQAGADIIDINMGCPAKKVCKKAAGSALLGHEALVAEILESVVKRAEAYQTPVTLKIRTGTDKNQRNALRIAKIAEDCGVKALTIHGRTRACKFNGEAEFDTIAEVKQQSRLPIIANGDITSAKKAQQVLAYTQADAIMIGRGAQGRPWLFQEIIETLQGQNYQAPSFSQKCQQWLSHITALHSFYGDYLGLRIARKHSAWYLHHLQLADLRKPFNRIDNLTQQTGFIHHLLNHEHTR